MRMYVSYEGADGVVNTLQVMLMVGTVLGPGTIFLMLVGSFNAAFGISNWDSLLYNTIPVFIFMFACMTCSSKIQVRRLGKLL